LKTSNSNISRRKFVTTTLQGGLATALAVSSRHSFGQRPNAPTNLRFGTGVVVKPSDLTYLGMFRFPNESRWNYSLGPISLRIVNGERRWLASSINATVAEVREPDTLGTSVSTAPDATTVREWIAPYKYEWNDSTAPSNGVVIGGFWWDQEQNVLWYTYYPYYAAGEHPFLGAVRLNDDGSVVKYGCWSVTGMSFRQVCNWILPLPQSIRSLVGNRVWALGATLIAMNTNCSFGPNLIALDKPALTQSTSQPLTGVPLVNYATGLGVSAPLYYCRRDTNYRVLGTSDSLRAPSGSEGFWASSVDMLAGCAWLDNGSRQGVVYPGRIGHGAVWYGTGTKYASEATDTCCPDQGYHAQVYDASWWIYDPANFCDVARGKLKPYNLKASSIFDPRTYWQGLQYPCDILYYGNGHGNVFFDSSTNRLYVMHPRTYNPEYSRLPTMNVWKLN
jgi:hypothetical protein